MNTERMKGGLADLLDTVNGQIRAIAEAQQKRVELTATATAGEGRVRITVNADGVVIETQFADDIDELDYDEIADAVTDATQEAAAEVARRADELIAPIQQTRERLPSLSEIVDGLPDLTARAPEQTRASFDPPSERDHTGDDFRTRRSPVADN
ncbi:YbaB/EbfC family nucleoid-associated protein [Nocardia mexicana]|uniref:DNA-binding protein YbaB n=1 Tax=Nocardia mexicana TaxID=279262 RepID=A0A370HE58_9NOCA|nr:YbaB/EbfC family nucleoid-associated protein [Nocardia mexicana]RDI55325.1 DNA-binding protein YbaB [Nocardia mexicana]